MKAATPIRSDLAPLLPPGAIVRWDDFLAHYYAPIPGQHHALIGPNGCGKTTAGIRLLAKARELHPHTRGMVLAMKPDKGPKSGGKNATGDRTVAQLTRQYGGRIVRTWPPALLPFQKEPAFWTFWPRHQMRPEIDRPAHTAAFREAILRCYGEGDWWDFCDEAYSLDEELGLEDELVTVLTKGRSMNNGGMLATQRPAHVTLSLYTESKHFFLWRMMDLKAYDRISEIGGGMVDKRRTVEILSRLGKHQCLYLYPDEGVMAVLV